MKKIKKARLSLKNKLYRFTIYYLTLVLSMQLSGSIQSLFYHKDIAKYKELVEDFGDYLREEGVSSSVDVFDYFNYALWGGYLSHNHSFSFDGKRKLFLKNAGLGCVSGDAVCLNNASMLTDLYEYLGYTSGLQSCYVPADDVSITPIKATEDIARTVKNQEFIEGLLNVFKPFALLFGNHAVTLVLEDGDAYYYDPTNLAYLSRDGRKLDILNGEGSFSKRFTATLLFGLDDAFKDFIPSNNEEYNLDYLVDRDPVFVDKEKLEEFYISEKALIDEIAESVNRKPNILTFLLSLFLSGRILTFFIKKLEKRKDLKYCSESNDLNHMITDFLKNNELKDFKDLCSYAHYLIDNGYLTTVGDRTLKMTLFEMPVSLVTVDKDEFGEYFFNSFIEGLIMFDQGYVYGVDGFKPLKRFYIHKTDEGTLFYSYEDNAYYKMDSNGYLVNGDKRYKLYNLYDLELKQGDDLNLESPEIDYSLLSDFALKNFDRVEEIAKSYSYKNRF